MKILNIFVQILSTTAMHLSYHNRNRLMDFLRMPL